MRRWIFFVSIALSVLSCKKENEPVTPEEDNTPGAILGTWELKESYSGMSPYMVHPPGNGMIMKFDSTTYQVMMGGQVQYQGTYRLVKDSVTNVNSCVLEAPSSSAPNRIIYDNEIHLRRGFTVTSKTLTLTIGCIPTDGGVSKYRRVDEAEIQ